MLFGMSVTRETLETLRAKYDEMLAMRLAHDSGEENAAHARARMAELATQFPGALREIDDLELDVIRARISQLDAVLRGAGAVEPWMEAVALFHALARGALWAKRWLGGRKTVNSAITRQYEDYAAHNLDANEALAWADDLARVAAPPRGRILDLVFARMARTLGTTEREARHLVFGVSRSARR
jgi:hypothetical protein